MGRKLRSDLSRQLTVVSWSLLSGLTSFLLGWLIGHDVV